MNGMHLVACCCLALALAGCRQTVVFDRGDGGQPADLSNFCLDGRRVRVHVEPRIPEVIVALDRSSGMLAPFGTTSTSQVEAALTTLTAAAFRYENLVWLGFVGFPGESDSCPIDAQECCGGQAFGFFGDPELFVMEARRCDISTRPGCVSSDQRPTSAVLNACREAYVKRGPTNHTQYVMLMTNGQPTCTGGGCQAATTASNLRGADIKTIVVVLGNVSEHDCLSTIALSGDADIGRDPFYYSAMSPDTLTTTVLTILGSVAHDACQLDVYDTIDDPDHVGVFWNNDGLPKGGLQGWDLDKNHARITLQGAACEEFLAGPLGELDVYECQDLR
jgi:hypothetical protein